MNRDEHQNELILSAYNDPVSFERGSIFFVGTATVILRYGGFTILTDPNFLHQGDHVHLGYGLQSERLTNPAIDIEELPPLDLVLLSHMHGDHFDRIAAEKLNKQLPIVTTHHATGVLQKLGFMAPHALKPWEELSVRKGSSCLKITAIPAKHGPGLVSVALPEVMGSLLEFEDEGHRRFCLYITGDTLLIDELKFLPMRFPDIDIALLHLGGTKVFGVLLTMDAKMGVRALELIAPKLAIPIHYNDYTVFKSPLEDFQAAVTAAGLAHKVRYLHHGDTFDFEVAALSQSSV